MNTSTGRRLAAALTILALAFGPTSAALGGQAKPASPAPVRVGGAIKPPVKIKNVTPVYPPQARNARVQGVVIVEATVGADGRVSATKVLRPILLLNDEAIRVVKGQEYKPTIVNGVAVPVIITVPVIFKLD
jgi:periplasmic protein TonB